MDGKKTEFLKKALDGVDPTINGESGQSGLGRSHRKGITLIKMFPDDKAARLWCGGAVWQMALYIRVATRVSILTIHTQIHAA